MLKLFLISLVLYVLILMGGFGFLYSRGFIGPGFFEHFAPTLELVDTPAGIGIEPTLFRIRVVDKGSGVDQVLVRAQQAKRKIDLFNKIYKKPVKEDIVDFEVAGKDNGLREGAVSLSIVAFDKSFFSNKATKTLEMPVDYRKPRLEVLSAQHNVNQGGVEFAFYKLVDGTAERSGVSTGNRKFFGFPARLINSGFENMPEVFCSFFAVPVGYDPDADPIAAFASNKVGNTNFTSFYYRVIPHRFKKSNVELQDYIARDKLQEFYTKLDIGEVENIPEDPAELAAVFEKTMNGMHASEQQELEKLSAESVQQQLWKVPFTRPLAGVVKGAFGEHRHYTVDGNEAGSWVQPGMELAASLRNSVFAINDGKVLYAGYFGTYGNTVIIDHGFGLFSLYGHLSSVRVEQGAPVQGGTEIGRTGTSGLADGDSLHFEIRLQGTPVNPIEWWDSRWINDHIMAKIQEVLGQAGAQVSDESSDQ